MIKRFFHPNKPSLFGDRFCFYSPKLRRWVSCASRLEFDRVLLFEFDPAVVSYQEQPLCVNAIVEGKRSSSIPDFEVHDRMGRRNFEEIKYSRDLMDPLSRAHRQVAIQKAWCDDHGHNHNVVTDSSIWSNPTLQDSLRTLVQYFDESYPKQIERAADFFAQIIEQVSRWPGITIADFLAAKPTGVDQAVYRLALLELIRVRKLDARLESVRLSPLSKLFPAKEAL